MTIEKLTDDEREYLDEFGVPESGKALRIIDAQAEEIERLRKGRRKSVGYARRKAVAANAAKAHLAEAGALLERINSRGGCGLDVHGWIDTYLANQPAALARTEAEQAVLDAMSVAVIAQHGGRVTIGIDSQDAAGRAELARRGLKP